MYLKTTTTVHLNIVFTIHRYQRNFTKHLYDGVCFGVGIIFYIIFNLIHIYFYQGFLGYYFNLSQFVGCIRNIQSTEIHQLTSCFYRKILHDIIPPYRRYCHHKITSSRYLFLKFTFHIRYQHLDSPRRSMFFSNLDSGVRLAFLSERIKQNTFHLKGGVCRVLCYCQAR